MSKFSISKVVAQQIALPAHTSLVSTRRVRRLAELIVSILPEGELKGLDIGCGSGEISKLVQTLHTGTHMQGSDLSRRPNAVIPVLESSGARLPFADESFDFAILIDVLHHSDDPGALLSEALRVSRRFVLIKDHYCQSAIDRLFLQFMDWVGNRAHDVPLPHNYLSGDQWQELYTKCSVTAKQEISSLGLYSQPLSLLFDRHLHFINKLEKTG